MTRTKIARAAGWLAYRLLDLQFYCTVGGRHPFARMADRINSEVASTQAAAKARQAWLAGYARVADFEFRYRPMLDGNADRVEVEIPGINGLSVWSVSADDPEIAVHNAARLLARRRLVKLVVPTKLSADDLRKVLDCEVQRIVPESWAHVSWTPVPPDEPERCGCDESKALRDKVQQRDALLAEQCQRLREALGKPQLFSLVEVVTLACRRISETAELAATADTLLLSELYDLVGVDSLAAAVGVVRELRHDPGLKIMSWRGDGARGLRLTVGSWEWERMFTREQWRALTPDEWRGDGDLVDLLCQELGVDNLGGVYFRMKHWRSASLALAHVAEQWLDEHRKDEHVKHAVVRADIAAVRGQAEQESVFPTVALQRAAASWKARPRDPARIPVMLDALRKEWELFPDLRLAQLVVNLAQRAQPGAAPFLVEDDVLLRHPLSADGTADFKQPAEPRPENSDGDE